MDTKGHELRELKVPDVAELIRNPLALSQWYARIGVTMPRPVEGLDPKEQNVDALANVFALPDASQVLGALTAAKNGAALLRDILEKREVGIRLMGNDPLQHGYEPECWGDARALLTGGVTAAGTKVEGHQELWILGGNDSMKSWFLAKLGVEKLVQEPGIEYVFGHNTEASSINQQQKIVHRFLPPVWRELKKAGGANVSFSRHGGFSENKFVLPNSSVGYFFFWRQQAGDLGGYKARGLSGDELITMAHVEELRARMLGKGGKIVVGFTPILGYTPPVADCLSGAKIVETRPSRFLPARNFPNDPTVPPGHMPYILQCQRPDAAVICFFTEWSPFRKDGELELFVAGKTIGAIKIRAYGWADKPVGNAIPKFSRAVNVIKRNPRHSWNGVGVVPAKPWEGTNHEGTRRDTNLGKDPNGENGKLEISDLKEETSRAVLYPTLPREGTNYWVCDPAGGAKNYVMKWYRVAPNGWTHVYREWPPMSTYGAWAEMTRPMASGDGMRMKYDGYPGPGQRYEYGRSIAGYKAVILEAEGWMWNEEAGVWEPLPGGEEKIFERYMDSRMGGAQVPSAESERTSIIQMFEEEQRDARGRLIGPSMIILPSHVTGGRSVANDRSLELLNDRFDYNTDERVTALNCPKWYAVDGCEQSILAYQEYTGADGEKGALKDLMDPDWYLVNADCKHVDETTFGSTRGGSY